MNKQIRKVVLLVEDKYGGEFFKKVINKLNNTNILKYNIWFSKINGKRNPVHLPYICNKKMEREINAVYNLVKPDKIMIILDGDKNQGENKYNENFNKAKKHIPKNIKIPYDVIIFDYEVEEWICISLDIKWNSKPSEELKNKFKYKKSNLPDYVEKLDFNKLKTCRSFKDFINSLNN